MKLGLLATVRGLGLLTAIATALLGMMLRSFRPRCCIYARLWGSSTSLHGFAYVIGSLCLFWGLIAAG
jgi:hypothetical protein